MQLLTFLLLLWSFQTTSDLNPDQEDNTVDVNRIALSFSGEASEFISNDHLETARRVGIRLIETDRPDIFKQHDVNSFLFLLKIDQKFMTPGTISIQWREIAAEVIEKFQSVESAFPGRVAAINLFQYPDDRSERFFEYSSLIADTLLSVTDLPLYYQTIPSSSPNTLAPYRFKSFTYSDQIPILSSAGNVIHFTPTIQLDESLLILESLFKALNETTEPIIIIPAGWFFQLLRSDPDMAIIFSSFTEGNIFPFPLPDVPPPTPVFNLSVFLLLLIWAGFLILYKYRPMFFDKCSRYFLNHKFFVQDVMLNRNRNLADGIYLLGLHLLVSALFCYTLSLILFGSKGFNVFSTHYNYFFVENYEAFSFLVFGFGISALLHAISIFWLYLFNKNLRRVSQVVNLYSWGFVMNLILVTLIVIGYQFDWEPLPALIFSFLYFMVWFLSFNIAAVNSARTMSSFKIPYLLLTIGIHTVLIIVLITLFLMEPQYYESISLAHWLSK